jgi:chromosome segregation ATPase
MHTSAMSGLGGPPTARAGGPAASRASLIADLANAHDRIARLSRELTQLRNRLSEQLGEQAWRDSGLGGPDTTEQLQRRVNELEQHAAQLCRQLADRDDELDAARATNRELMTQLNRPTPTHTDGRHY